MPFPPTPPREVLAAFGLDGDPTPLTGGRGTSWRVGQAVIKPLDMSPAMHDWQVALLPRLADHDDFRVSDPLRAHDGAWVAAGWTAWRYQPGSHAPRRWHDIIAAGERLHAALAGHPKPDFLGQRTDQWATADAVAWGELPNTGYPDGEHLRLLQAALRPVSGDAQLVHGDLTGNVLFHPNLPPLIIDLSPYWRPPAYASAIVVADALTFEGASSDVVEPLLDDPQFPQYLVRALLFRAVSDHIAFPEQLQRQRAEYGPAVELAVELALDS